jgi:EmrB/QacA subfamily drug resistance transporter
MVLLDVSIVNVALPSIRTGLAAPESDLQWVVSGYALTFGLLLVPAGRLGDVRGRRTMFVAALALFTLASAACGAAPTSLTLVLARLAQGLAGGLLTPQISALIQQMFQGRERGVAFGIFGTMVGVATAIGPLLGGVLIAIFGTHAGWRAVFFVNLPIGVLAIPLALRLLPPPERAARGRRHDYDPVGVLLLGAGVAALLLPFVQQQQWHDERKWLLVLFAAVLLAGFVGWEARYARRGREPVVDLGLYRHRSFSCGSSMITLYFAGFTPLFFVFTLYLQVGLHYSALLAGASTVTFALGSAVSAAVGGRIVHRFGRRLVLLGLVAVAIGLGASILAVHEVPVHNTGWATALPLLLAGLGSGLVIAPNQALSLSEVPVEHAGTAGGLLQTGQRVGSAVGIAAAGSVFFAHLGAGGGFVGAYERGILVAVAFVVAAAVIAIAEIAFGGRADRPGRTGHGDERRLPQSQRAR